jgi:hypothetical protein
MKHPEWLPRPFPLVYRLIDRNKDPTTKKKVAM